ncbi:ABC transporter ATP-binding protein [Starkeya sp. ORNL1]|nr:ABC transporter ATP-binding protein [Starkeya sp. ORNL1]
MRCAVDRPALLEVAGLRKAYARGGVATVALDGIDLGIARGETLALAGASGSGKTTLARCILRLAEPDAGTIRFDGADLLALRGGALRAVRPRLQMVFQDPLAAFNPRATVARLIEDPLRLHRIVPRGARRAAVLDLLARVHLPADIAGRRPHEISGGQRQRVAIARAIATRPDLIVLDEPVSALDVSVRAQILNLLMDLQDQSGVAYLLISHDLAVVHAVARRVAIMEAGRIVESGATDAVFAAPEAAATRTLLRAAPRLKA